MFTSKHNPAGGARAHFNNEAITAFLGRYQAGDPDALTGIITSTQERAKTLIRFLGSARYLPEGELLSNLNWKLLRAIPHFNCERGSAFSYISCLIENELRSSVSRERTNTSRYGEPDEKLASSLPAKSQGELAERIAAEDLAHRIHAGVKTTLSDERELSTQRWYVESFTDEAFAQRRHQCADAAMPVYGLSHARARELYDLTPNFL